MKWTMPALFTVAVGTLPLTASAHDWNFCMKWAIQQTDGNAGEDYYKTDTIMKARGAKVAVMHDNWILPKLGYASEADGCYSFAANETTGFRVTLWAESKIGAASNISIKAYETEADADAVNVKYWYILANPGTAGGTITLQNTASNLSNLIAWSTFVVYWIDHLTSPRIAGYKTLNVINEQCPVVGGSCHAGVSEVYIQNDGANDAHTKKFLFGHEVGHWIVDTWVSGSSPSNDYSYSPPTNSPAACKYTGVGSHALRSQEWNASAFLEGVAHFLSTLAFNDHTSTNGYFRYYKDLSSYSAYDDLEADQWIVNVENPSGSTGGWLAASCSWASGTGVEIDWLRHYWDFRTNAGAAPTHYQIFKHLDYSSNTYPWARDGVYLSLGVGLYNAPLGLTSAQQNALVDRWTGSAEWNGIDQ